MNVLVRFLSSKVSEFNLIASVPTFISGLCYRARSGRYIATTPLRWTEKQEDSGSGGKDTVRKGDKLEVPEPPSSDLCCMSGCPKCIFVVYADELKEYCKKTGTNPDEEIRNITKDVSMQMIIKMMLKEDK